MSKPLNDFRVLHARKIIGPEQEKGEFALVRDGGVCASEFVGVWNVGILFALAPRIKPWKIQATPNRTTSGRNMVGSCCMVATKPA